MSLKNNKSALVLNSFLRIFLFFVFSILLQIVASKFLAVQGVFPNFLLLATLYVGLNNGSMPAMVLGFFWGMVLDILSLSLFGSQMFMLTLLGFVSGFWHGKIDQEHMLSQLLSVLAMVLLFSLGIVFWNAVLGQNMARFYFDLTAWQSLYTVLISPLFFMFCSWVFRR